MPPVTYASAARTLGVTTRCIASIFARWQRSGLLQRVGPRLRITDRAAFERLAGSIRGGLVYRMGVDITLELPVVEPPPVRILAIGPETDSTAVDSSTSTWPIEDELVIGRSRTCTVRLRGQDVAPIHCRIFRSPRGGRHWLQHLGRDSVTLCNGMPTLRTVLQDGDRITVGGVVFFFRDRSELEVAERLTG
jgi:hypothetical protein